MDRSYLLKHVFMKIASKSCNAKNLRLGNAWIWKVGSGRNEERGFLPITLQGRELRCVSSSSPHWGGRRRKEEVSGVSPPLQPSPSHHSSALPNGHREGEDI